VYVWPTSGQDKSDNEKRPVEMFEAHSAIVTTAVMAPEQTRRLLAQSGDPLYDLCNPPPVTLVSRADSVISSRAPTNNSVHSDEKRGLTESGQSESPKRAPLTPAYLARQSHVGGQIIVTADYTGQIKVFRQDCAFQKRRHESWDANSTFSKKMLARTGSIARRNSTSSSTHRNSFATGTKSQSTDRILNWRNSVGLTEGTSASASMLEVRTSTNTERSRSASPKEFVKHRFSLRRPSPPDGKDRLLSPTSAENHSSPLHQMQNGPSISIQSPTTAESPGSFRSVAQQKTPDYERNLTPTTFLKPTTSNNSTAPADDMARTDNLLLGDQHSYMGWDVRNTLVPMAQHPPRTPSAGRGPDDGNPLSRAGSYVSQLSSELTGSEGGGGDDRPSPGDSVADADPIGGADDKAVRTAGGKLRKPRPRRRSSGAESASDLRCRKCGNKTFKATMTDKGQSFRCKKCGTVV
jgi:hypothetical protein